MKKVTIAYIFLSLTRKQSTIEVSKKKKSTIEVHSYHFFFIILWEF